MPEPQSKPPEHAAGTQDREDQPEYVSYSQSDLISPQSHESEMSVMPDRDCDSDTYLEWMEKFQYPPFPKEKKALNQMTDEEMKQFITKRIRYEIGRDKEMTNHREIWFKRIMKSDQASFDD